MKPFFVMCNKCGRPIQNGHGFQLIVGSYKVKHIDCDSPEAKKEPKEIPELKASKY